MNLRRFMSDMGLSPTARRSATGEPGDPRSRFAATLSLTRSDRHVLGADLNRSESRLCAACPSCASDQPRIAHGERLDGHVEDGCTNAYLDFKYSCQASAEQFQQCAQFLPLRKLTADPARCEPQRMPARRCRAGVRDREDDGVGGRVDIETDHIPELVGELRIVRQLECPDTVRRELVGLRGCRPSCAGTVLVFVVSVPRRLALPPADISGHGHGARRRLQHQQAQQDHGEAE
jgi:hypothetical protein